MKIKLLIISMCLLSIVLLGQKQIDNKTSDKSTFDKPTFSRETPDAELSKPIKSETPPTSVIPKPEDQAWQMIFDALEKEEPSDLSSSKPQWEINMPSEDGSGGGEAISSSRGHERLSDIPIPVDIGGVAGRGSAGQGNSSRASVGHEREEIEVEREEIEIEIEDDDDREGLPSNRPPGWDVGKKEGWKGGNVPPGLATPPGLRKRNQNRQGIGN